MQRKEKEMKECYSLPATVVPDASLTLNADGVAADAGASVRLEALPAVAHPGLTYLMEYVLRDKTQYYSRKDIY